MEFLSSSEKNYIIGGFEANCRGDGRSRVDFRPFEVKTGMMAQANGSARLRMGETDVVVGVKIALGVPLADAPDKGRIIYSVECSPIASRSFEGRGAEEQNEILAHGLREALGQDSGLDLKSLCLAPGKHCWILYVDAVILSSGGNLLGSLTLAARAALSDTSLPKINAIKSSTDIDLEFPEGLDEEWKFGTENMPVCITVSVSSNMSVIDANLPEELACSSHLNIGVNRNGLICSIGKGGSGSVSRTMLNECIDVACKIGKKITNTLDFMLKEKDLQSTEFS